MTTIELPPLPQGICVAEATAEGDSVTFRISGTADLRAKDALEDVLEKLDNEARRLRARQVVVDFRRLEFMNSSCFKNLLTWISTVQELPPEDQYKIRFLSDPEMLWQRRSLHALSCFAADLVTIDG